MTTIEPPRAPTPSPLPPSSRYVDVEVTSMEIDGETVHYYRRRFLPAAEDHAITHERKIENADRLDTIAAAEHADAELWWRIADANGAMRPTDLVEPGEQLRIALPFGMPRETA